MIIINNLHKEYVKNKKIKLIYENLNVTFKQGLNIILGKSGSGKTTLLNIIAGLTSYDGVVKIDNLELEKYKNRASLLGNLISYITQDYNLLNELNVYDNLTINLVKNKKEKIDKKLVINTLKKVNLNEDILDKKIDEISGGEAQRIAIARILLNDSKIILADEPTGNLDEDNALKILKLFKYLSKSCTIILVTHNKSLAYKFADGLYEVNDKKLRVLKENQSIENNKKPSSQNKKPAKLNFFKLFKFSNSILNNKKFISFFLSLALIFCGGFLSSGLDLIDNNIPKELDEVSLKYNISSGLIFKQNEISVNQIDLDNEIINSELVSEINALSKEKNLTLYPAYVPSPYIEDSPSLNTLKELDFGNHINNILVSDNNEIFNDLGLTLIGSLPKDNEVILTNETLLDLGWIGEYYLENTSILSSFIGKTYKLNVEGTTSLKISGIVINNHYEQYIDENSLEVEKYYDLYKAIFLNTSTFNKINENYGDISMFYFKTSEDNFKKVIEIINTLNNIDANANLNIGNILLTSSFSPFTNSDVISIFLIFLVFVIIILLIYLFNYAYSIVTIKQNTINKLLKIGFTKLESFKMYILNLSLINLISLPFYYLIYYIVNIFLNNLAFNNQTNLILTSLVNYEFYVPIIIFIITLTILTSITFLIYLRLTSKKNN